MEDNAIHIDEFWSFFYLTVDKIYWPRSSISLWTFFSSSTKYSASPESFLHFIEVQFFQRKTFSSTYYEFSGAICHEHWKKHPIQESFATVEYQKKLSLSFFNSVPIVFERWVKNCSYIKILLAINCCFFNILSLEFFQSLKVNKGKSCLAKTIFLTLEFDL